MLSLHTLPAQPGKKKKRVGRGNSSSGNYSGRGMKGQRSRSGGKGGLKLRGLKQSMMALPKSRGFNSGRVRPQTVSLKQLEKFESGATVTGAELVKKGMITNARKAVKVLGTGKLTKKLTVHLQAVSKTAADAIAAAGGTFESTPLPKREKRTTKKSESK